MGDVAQGDFAVPVFPGGPVTEGLGDGGVLHRFIGKRLGGTGHGGPRLQGRPGRHLVPAGMPFRLCRQLVVPCRTVAQHSHETNAITLPDYLEAHFNDKTNVLRLISVIIIFACMMAYVGRSSAAIGKTFDAIFGVPHHVSIPIGAAIIILYTMLGGFLAVAWTDFVQGLIMVIGLVVLSGSSRW